MGPSLLSILLYFGNLFKDMWCQCFVCSLYFLALASFSWNKKWIVVTINGEFIKTMKRVKRMKEIFSWKIQRIQWSQRSVGEIAGETSSCQNFCKFSTNFLQISNKCYNGYKWEHAAYQFVLCFNVELILAWGFEFYGGVLSGLGHELQ